MSRILNSTLQRTDIQGNQNILLEAWGKGRNALEERMGIINQHFAQHLIDVQHPYLNPASEDVYQPLN